jgi:hypothetical protein
VTDTREAAHDLAERISILRNDRAYMTHTDAQLREIALTILRGPSWAAWQRWLREQRTLTTQDQQDLQIRT